MIHTRRDMLIRAATLICALTPVAIVGGIVGSRPASAEDDDDHRAGDARRDDLHDKVERGQLKSLAELRRVVTAAVPGKIVDTDAENEDGGVLYEFKVLTAAGRVVEVEVDGASGRILRIEND